MPIGEPVYVLIRYDNTDGFVTVGVYDSVFAAQAAEDAGLTWEQPYAGESCWSARCDARDEFLAISRHVIEGASRGSVLDDEPF
jgi:hypothetical protein